MDPTAQPLKRVVLHVGLHKTGTTSIQWALTHSRAQLAARGLLYPEIGVPKLAPFGQHLLPWSLLERSDFLPMLNGQRVTIDPTDLERLWRDLRREIDLSSAHTVILSSEEFDVLRASEIVALHQQLSDYNVEPVLFIRNHADFLDSAYRTSVISGYTGGIRDFVAGQRSRLDYAQMLHDWAAIARDGRVVIVNYDDPKVRTNSVATFLRIVGLEAEILAPRALQHQNESLPAFIVEIVRFLRLKGVTNLHVSGWIDQIRRTEFDPASRTGYTCLPSDLRAELNERHTQEIASILADSRLNRHMYGTFAEIKSSLDRVAIRHVVDAILALGHALGPRRPPSKE